MITTITFHPDGTATTLHTDAIPLAEIGHLQIERASTIEFNEADQLWEVRIREAVGGSNAVYYRNPSRAACIAWEVEQLNGKV